MSKTCRITDGGAEMTQELDFGQPQISAQLEYWQGQAKELSAKLNNIAMCVVQEITTGGYQVFHKWIVDNYLHKQPVPNYKIVYTVGGTE